MGIHKYILAAQTRRTNGRRSVSLRDRPTLIRNKRPETIGVSPPSVQDSLLRTRRVFVEARSGILGIFSKRESKVPGGGTSVLGDRDFFSPFFILRDQDPATRGKSMSWNCRGEIVNTDQTKTVASE